MSAVSGASGADTAIQLGMAAFETATSIFGYFTQEITQDAQRDMALAQYNHQDKMAKSSADMQLATLASKEAQQNIVADGTAKLNSVTEERKQVEARGKETNAAIAQAKLSSATGKNLNLNQYFYGNPLA